MRFTATLITTCLLATVAVRAQAPSTNALTDGIVVSATRATMVVRSGEADYKLFVLDADTLRPAQIPAGASVTIASRASEDPAAPIATSVKVTALPTPPAPGAAAPAQEVVPPSVRRLERSVARQTQRFRLGVRSGATLDEELISLGAHVQVGPFFSDRVWARPNVELGFGEVTTLFALNFEAIYRMPVTQRDGRYAVYFGGGPGLNFIDQGFDLPGDDDDTRFDNFDLDLGFNILMGVQARNGLFLELKSAAYAAPHIRFIVGYNF